MSKTTAGRALQQRQRDRRLPSFDIPQGTEPQLVRALESIAEHLRMYEGNKAAPKERFVTLAELENAGLIKSDVKQGFGYISQLVGKDVAQQAGSTANPTLTDKALAPTSRQSRLPGGAGGTGTSTGGTSTGHKLGDANNATFINPAQNDFIIYDGGIWKNFSLFSSMNRWTKRQQFEQPVSLREQTVSPAAVPDRGLLYTKDDQSLYFMDSAGLETDLLSAGATTLGGLTDVTLTSPTTGDVLRYNGSVWVNYPDSNFAAASHTHVLADVTDVTATAAEVNLLDLSGLTAGWALIADSATTASWQALPSGGIGGSITDNQVAVGAATADTIEGSADFTWTAATGQLYIADATGPAGIQIFADSGGTGTGTDRNPYIHFLADTSISQVESIIGQTRINDQDPLGNTLLAADATDLVLHQNVTGAGITLGVGGRGRLRLEEAAIFWHAFFSGTTRYVTWTDTGSVGEEWHWDFTSFDDWRIQGLTDGMYLDGSFWLQEKAAGAADRAAYGQLWVKNDTPNTLWFTDDAGTDVQLGVGGLQASDNATITGAWTFNQDLNLATTAALQWGATTYAELVAGDTAWANVALLAEFEGPDAATSYTSIDSTGHAATFNGSAELDTAQKKFGASSFKNSTTGSSYVSFASHADFNVGTQDWTLELWVRYNSLPGLAGLFDMRSAGVANSNHIALHTDASNNFVMYVQGVRITSTTTVSAGTWYHVALCRSGTTTRLFINGTQDGSWGADSTTYLQNAIILGALGDSRSVDFDGWIDGVRFTVGTARYTSNFTVPAGEYPTGNSVFTVGEVNSAATFTGSALDVIPDTTFRGNVDVTGTLAATTVTGANVTSGADPGHTHTAYLTAESDTLATVTGRGATTATASTFSGGINMSDSDLNRPVIEDYGVTHQAPTVSANAVTVDLTLGNSALIDMDPATADVTLTLSNPPASGTYGEVNLIIVMGTPPYDITWPGSVVWQGGGAAPTLSITNDTVDLVHLFTVDGGTTWYGTAATAVAPQITNHDLDSHSDVTITSAATGDILRYNGTAWVDYPDSNYAAASHTHTLSDVTDVTATAAELNLLDLSGLTAGWALVADSATTASWQAIGTGNVNVSGTPADGQVAVWTAADTIEGDADFTWTDTTGVLSIGHATGPSGLIINADSGGTGTGNDRNAYVNWKSDTSTFQMNAVAGHTRLANQDALGNTMTGTASGDFTIHQQNYSGSGFAIGHLGRTRLRFTSTGIRVHGYFSTATRYVNWQDTGTSGEEWHWDFTNFDDWRIQGLTDGVYLDGSLWLEEKAAGAVDRAGYGQLWVKSDTPSTLWYTDDAGTDFQLGTGGLPTGTTTGSVLRWNGADWIEETNHIVGTNGSLSIDGVSAGGQALIIDCTTSWTSGTLYMPGILMQEADGTDVASVRGYVDSSDTKVLSLCSGNFGTERLRLQSNGAHYLTGSLGMTGTLSFDKDGTIFNFNAQTVEAAHATPHELGVAWSGTHNRVYFVPRPEGSADFSKEFSYNFAAGAEKWQFDSHLDVGGDLDVGNTIFVTNGINMSDSDLNRPVIEDYGIKHQVATVSANAVTVNCTLGNSVYIDMDPATADVTLTLSNPPASGTYGEVNLVIQMGTPAHGITWPGSVTWLNGGGAPTLSVTNNDVDIVHLFTIDGGTTWYGTFALAGAGGVTTHALDDHSDVSITAAGTGDYLRYNGSAWVDNAGVEAADIQTGNLQSGVNTYITASSAATSFVVPFLNSTSGTSGATSFLKDSVASFTYNPNTNTLGVSNIDMSDGTLTTPELDDYSISSTSVTPTGTTQTCTYSTSQSYEVDLGSTTGNITITLSGGPPAGTYGEMIIKVTQHNTVNRTITWAGGTFEWPGGTAPTMSTGADAIDIYHFSTWNSGTNWFGSVIQGMA